MTPTILTKVIRLDSLPLGQTFYTEEGYLRDRPILTRCGIFEYTNPDGSVRRELRLPEDVFEPASLASYKGKPIIITHDAGLVDKDNVHDEIIGTILSEGYRSGDDVRADIVIHDTDAMKDCQMKELSLGYSLDLDETPGVWNGMPYDARQRNIRINHLALVSEARAGDKARLNIDGRGSKKTLEGGNDMKTHKQARKDGILSAEELEQAIAEYKANHQTADETPVADAAEEETPVVETPAETPVEETTEQTAETPATDGEEPATATEGGDTVETQVEAIKEANADADPEMQKLFDIIDSLLAEREFKKTEGDCGETKAVAAADEEGENAFEVTPATTTEEEDGEDETETAEPIAAPAEVKTGETVNTDSIDAFVSAKIQVGMIGRSINLDGLETMKLMDARKAVIKAVRPRMNLDGKSDAYVNAAYEIACDEIRSRNVKDTQYQKRQMFNADTRKDSAANEESATNARERMIARQQKKKEEL